MRYIAILLVLSSLNASGQFFYENPVDSGAFYLKVFKIVGEKEYVHACSKTRLMYFFQPNRAGLSYKDATIMMFPRNEDADDFINVSADGTEWSVSGMKSEVGLPDYIEFTRITPKGYSYQISNQNFCP